MGEMKFLDYKPEELNYAAGARCDCGAGLAYPEEDVARGRNRVWVCSALLKGEVAFDKDTWGNSGFLVRKVLGDDGKEHAAYPFAFYDVKSERQPSAGGRTTRPDDEDKPLSYDAEEAQLVADRLKHLNELRNGLPRALRGDYRDVEEWIHQMQRRLPAVPDVAGALKKTIAAALRHNPIPKKLVEDVWSSLAVAVQMPASACYGCGKEVGSYQCWAHQRRWHSECQRKAERDGFPATGSDA